MGELAVGAKRYDGGSGPAVFTGVIPLKPSQLFEADLGKVKLLDGGTEIGCSTADLWPRHTDGSLKVIRVAATLDLVPGVQKNLILRLGETRTVAGPALPTINLAWMKNPRLIGSTDAVHLCASRVAPLPLVPIPHPNLSARWNKFLTEEWDDAQTGATSVQLQFPNWGLLRARTMADAPSVVLGGNAAYNFISAMYCKYLTSGSLDRLREAHRAAQYGSAERMYNHGFPYSLWGYCFPSNLNPDPYRNNGHLNELVRYADGTIFNANPEGWEDFPAGQGSMSTGLETRNNDLDMYMMYALGGWEQAKGTFLCRTLDMFCRGTWPYNPPAHVPLDNALGSNLGTQIILDNQYKGNYSGRSQWRHYRNADYLYYLLSPPDALYAHRWNGRYVTMPSPRTSPAADWKQWFKREHLDFYEKYSDRYVTGHWLKGSWWSTPGWGAPSGPPANVPQGLPFFQLKLLVFDTMIHYMTSEPDQRVLDNIVRTASLLRSCLFGPTANAQTPGTQGFKLPYTIENSYTNNATDGPAVASSGNDFWPVTTCLMIFVLAWRLTGDTFYRDLCEMHASHRYMALSTGYKAGFNSPKEAGETYLDAFYAAAYMAGVPLGAWEIDGEVIFPDPDPVPDPDPDPDPVPDPDPEPEPEPGDIMTTIHAVIQNEEQIHETNYTGVRIRFQRSTDQGATWVDVQSNIRPLGADADSYGVPVGAIGDYRAGAALTNGTVFGTEVFSAPRTIAMLQTPTNIVLTIIA